SDPTIGPYSLPQIREAVAFKAVRGGFLDPLRVFLKDMVLEWTEVPTACASRRENKPVIQLGRRFFQQEVRNESEAADIVFHEIMHHLLRHLLIMKNLHNRGYSHDVQNLAMDSIINAHLASVGCADFMERYYPDRGEFAFLRPNSREFMVARGFWRWRSIVPVRKARAGKSQQFHAFYRRLYALDATLEQALDFFQKHFPKSSMEFQLMGGHGDQDGPASKNGSQDELFDAAEARKILEALNIIPKEVSKQTRDNFAEIIRRVASIVLHEGTVRAERRVSRRVPAKLNRRDVLNLEREHYVFQRPDYRLKEIVLFPDISGSMDKYIPFMIGLIAKLRKADLSVRTVCWASRPVEVPFTDILQGKLPSKAGRGGTDGEALAQFMQAERIEQAVIITDNAAGRITTKVRARVQLCLVEGGNESGSFLDRTVVPHCTLHRLKLGGR
ncbi:MAG TPA: hypothetical protein V6D17_01970, partial [Candidatus Obscuribacterales bacterium]